MTNAKERLRQLPPMDALITAALADPRFAGRSREACAETLRTAVQACREALLLGERAVPDTAAILERAAASLTPPLAQRPVYNATGVLLHTNLGRAPLCEDAAQAIAAAATAYTALEFDCATGARGDRHLPIEALLQRILGVESALVVNNNAAAVLLCLCALAPNKEVVVSRGELVEIGGAFRMPEMMALSGCVLKEVGTTNKTRLSDYEGAIGERTGALLKVHTSNYRIVGFTEEVSPPALATLGQQRGLPVVYDLGGGAMLPLAPYGLPNEPTVQDALASGVDAVCFSGDKLLGGPQCGLIVGKRSYIAAMKRHPLLRVLRVDKLTLAALEATLRLYLHPTEAAARLPLYQMLGEPVSVLEEKGNCLLRLLADTPRLCATLVESEAQIGAGAVPCTPIPSRAVRLCHADRGAQALYARLLQGEPPVVGRVHKEGLLLDMRTLPMDAVETVAAAVRAACEASV